MMQITHDTHVCAHALAVACVCSMPLQMARAIFLAIVAHAPVRYRSSAHLQAVGCTQDMVHLRNGSYHIPYRVGACIAMPFL